MADSHPTTPGVVFKSIDRFPGYCFGSDGSWWSCRSNSGGTDRDWRRLKICFATHTPTVSFCGGGDSKSCSARRIFLEAFAGPCPEGHEPESIDGDVRNLEISNLRWSLPENSRFWGRLRPTPAGCWEWQGAAGEKGYGHIKFKGKGYIAHQLAYELAVGPRNGLCVLHRCDNPPCCRPSHLFLGTRGDNARDMISKGRHSLARFLPENTPKGERKPNAKLTEQAVREIRSRRAAGEPLRVIADHFGVSIPLACEVANRRVWTHVQDQEAAVESHEG